MITSLEINDKYKYTYQIIRYYLFYKIYRSIVCLDQILKIILFLISQKSCIGSQNNKKNFTISPSHAGLPFIPANPDFTFFSFTTLLAAYQTNETYFILSKIWKKKIEEQIFLFSIFLLKKRTTIAKMNRPQMSTDLEKD